MEKMEKWEIEKGFDIYNGDNFEPFVEFIMSETDFNFAFFETKREVISFLDFHSDSGIFHDEEILEIFEDHEKEIYLVLKKHQIDLKDFYNEWQKEDKLFLPSMDELKVIYFRKAWKKAIEDIIEYIEEV